MNAMTMTTVGNTNEKHENAATADGTILLGDAAERLRLTEASLEKLVALAGFKTLEEKIEGLEGYVWRAMMRSDLDQLPSHMLQEAQEDALRSLSKTVRVLFSKVGIRVGSSIAMQITRRACDRDSYLTPPECVVESFMKENGIIYDVGALYAS